MKVVFKFKLGMIIVSRLTGVSGTICVAVLDMHSGAGYWVQPFSNTPTVWIHEDDAEHAKKGE